MTHFIIIAITSIVSLSIILSINDKQQCCNANEASSYTFRYSIDAAPLLTQHWEERRGDIVHGSYSFLDPDGKIRVVEYQVSGPGGFRAVVRYRLPPTGFPMIEHLKYPESHRHPVPLAKPVGHITEDLWKKRH